MVTLNSIVRYLNKELDVKGIPDDSSRNGLQVKANSDIRKIGFSVDACVEVFEKAKKQGCDLVIVHHGILWKDFKYPKEWKQKRIDYLKKHKISLYACHLPLDKHETYGNNVQLANILKLTKIKPFGAYHGYNIGYQGVLSKPLTIGQLAKILDQKIDTKSFTFPFGKKNIRTIGIVSGGGASALPEAISKKLDCFITGELGHSLYHYMKEYDMNTIVAGHYATETVGVKALVPVLKQKFGVDVIYIDAPTRL